MKRLLYLVFIIGIVVLLLGVKKPSLDDQINQFEEQIELPNNTYDTLTDETTFSPNLLATIGRNIEKGLESIIHFIFQINK